MDFICQNLAECSCDWQYFDDVIFNLILIHLAGWEDACHFSQETKIRPYQSHSDCPVKTDYTCWKWLCNTDLHIKPGKVLFLNSWV